MTRNELLDGIDLANGKDDCTCNVAAGSSNPLEHDRYCAFRLLKEAAAHIKRNQTDAPIAAAVEEERERIAMWHEHEAELATNSLHCGDNSMTISFAHRTADHHRASAAAIRETR